MKNYGTAVIMAGGNSSRMGFDKQLIKIGDKFLIDIIIENLKIYFDEIIIVSNRTSLYKDYDLFVIEDEIKEVGPLGGLHVALKYSKSLYSYVIACDMPYINIQYIKFMLNILKQTPKVDALVTKLGDWIEPFNSFYSKEMIEEIENHIITGRRSVYSLLIKLNVLYIEEEIARKFSSSWKMFQNLNTRDDLVKLYMEVSSRSVVCEDV